MASRPDEVIAAQSYANSVPHIELLEEKRKQIDREIDNTKRDQGNSALILRSCVSEKHPTKLYIIAGDKFLLVTWKADGAEFKIISPENMPVRKPQQPMAEPYQSGRRVPPVVKGVAAEILARLPADMKVGREIVAGAAQDCAEPTTILCKPGELETAKELLRAEEADQNMASAYVAEAEMIDHG